MGLPKTKINSNIAHKPKKWLPLDELHVRQNRFLLQFQAIYALYYSFAILFFYYFVFWNLTPSLFLFSFFCSAPWLSKPWEPTILCHQPTTRSTMPIYLTHVAPESTTSSLFRGQFFSPHSDQKIHLRRHQPWPQQFKYMTLRRDSSACLSLSSESLFPKNPWKFDSIIPNSGRRSDVAGSTKTRSTMPIENLEKSKKLVKKSTTWISVGHSKHSWPSGL